MMAKKQKIPMWGWIIIALLILLVLNQRGIIDIPIIPGEVTEPPELTPTGDCSLTLDKYLINVGETVKGTIYDGPLATCEVLIKHSGGVWISIGTYRLDSNGYFSLQAPIPFADVFEVLAICTGTTGSCKTNTEILTVIGAVADTDGDGIPDDIDPDDDNDGYSDEEEAERGTNPLDSGDYPFDCSAYCQNLDTPHSELYDGFYTGTLPICEDTSRELCPTNHIHIYNRGGNGCCCLVCLDGDHQPYPY